MFNSLSLSPGFCPFFKNSDGIVLTERTDRFEVNGQWMDILVMGVMEFQDGLISNWRDYFDMKAYEAETSRVLG